MKRLSILLVTAGTIAALAGPANAAKDFYDGRQVKIVVPAGSGGTYHLYSQILSRHLGKHLPGKTSVVTQNMPGAGGAKAARYMVTAAPKDGSYISMINPGAIVIPLMRPKVGFDTREMKWLGSMSGRAYTVGVWHTTPVKNIEDAKKTVVIMGTTGLSSNGYLIPKFMNKTIGTKFKIIAGYKGGGAINVAIERGEIQGRGNFYTGYLGVRPQWIRDKKITFLARLGPERPDIQYIPKLRDMMENDLQRQMLDVLEANFNVGQAFFAPPGIAKARLATLRKAFVATMKDPATKKATSARFLPLRWQTHQQVEKAIETTFNTPPKVYKKLAKMLGFDKARKKKKKKK